jgi:hypothetical protein
VPANLLAAASIVVVVAVWAAAGLLAAILVAPLVAFPIAGLARLTGFIVRGQDAVLSDAWSGWRSTWRETLALGTASTVATVIFGTNVLVGITAGPTISLFIAVLAGWGLVGTWVYGLVAWPILLDPTRADVPSRERFRLAALLVIAVPLRLLGFALLVGAFLAISTVLFAAAATVSLAFAALVAGRYVLPASDRLAARLGIIDAAVIPD